MEDRGEWWLYPLYGALIVTDIKVGRLKWLGNIQRMNTNEMAKRIMGKHTNVKKEVWKTQI